MEYKIIADSCCDLTRELKAKLATVHIPLTMTLGGESFTDDQTLDMPNFMRMMKACKERIGSAAPSPMAFFDTFKGNYTSFAITISSSLSSTYSSAVMAANMIRDAKLGDAHVFDSKSASAAESLIAIKLFELIEKQWSKPKIIDFIEHYIDEMKTYFVLENMDNLVKNGRMNKVAGKLISALNIKPIMGADSTGNIAFYTYARGRKQIVQKMVGLIKKCADNYIERDMVITHCDNLELAQNIKTEVKNKFAFRDIFIIKTGGLSSMYANEGGIIMSY